MSENAQLANEVEAEIDAHLDEVENVLRGGGVSRSERQNVCDELKCQIGDMLSERSSGAPTAADVKALLAELDPPDSFGQRGEETNPQSVRSPKVLPLAVAAASTVILGVIGAYIYAELGGAESDRQQAAIIAFLITFLALVMGITAIREIREIRQDPKSNRGYLLAFIGVIGLPICFLLWANREIANPYNTQLRIEVHEYNRALKLAASAPDTAELVGEEQTPKPFIPWITTGRDARSFAYMSCFGPTLLLSVVFVPWLYRRLRPAGMQL